MQGEVLEELQHNYPLELLMALSNAAISAMKVLNHVRFGDSARGWDHLAFDLAGCHLKTFRLCDAGHKALITCKVLCVGHIIM